VANQERKFDPRDWATQDSRARSWLDHMNEFVAGSLAAKDTSMLTADDEEWLKIGGEKARTAFEQLSKFFVAPLQELRPSTATHGHMMLLDLMVGAFAIGSRGNISESARKIVTRTALAPLSAGGSKGGKKTGATKSAEADRAWRNAAKELWATLRGTHTQSALANLIADKIPKAPSTPEIILFIRKLDRDARRNVAAQ
jgi:hypothetical protein